MSPETWMVFALTEAVMCLIPGPAVLLVVSVGLTRGQVPSIFAGLGILAANAFYFVLSATGVGALLMTSHGAFVLLKWLGAAYLLWLGGRMLLAGPPQTTLTDGCEEIAAERNSAGDRQTFIRGFLAQAANPKALVFFLSLLPQFVNPAAPLLPQITLLAVTSMAIEFVILSGYASLAGRAAEMADDSRLRPVVERTGGTLLIAAAMGLASIPNRES